MSATLENSNEEAFLVALRNVVKASISITELTNQTQRNRESLYKTLSERGNPHLYIYDGRGVRKWRSH